MGSIDSKKTLPS